MLDCDCWDLGSVSKAKELEFSQRTSAIMILLNALAIDASTPTKSKSIEA